MGLAVSPFLVFLLKYANKLPATASNLTHSHERVVLIFLSISEKANIHISKMAQNPKRKCIPSGQKYNFSHAKFIYLFIFYHSAILNHAAPFWLDDDLPGYGK